MAGQAVSPLAQDSLENFELTCFQLVAQVGDARSCFMEAIAAAEEGDFEHAEQHIEQGSKSFTAGHAIHMDLLSREAQGESLPFRIILLHAEDLMASAETFHILAEKFIKLYKRIA